MDPEHAVCGGGGEGDVEGWWGRRRREGEEGEGCGGWGLWDGSPLFGGWGEDEG